MSVASLINNSTLSITSAILVHVPAANANFYLTSAVIAAVPNSSPSYSVWDMQLTNWTSTNLGDWYYFCPDVCNAFSNVEKSWIPFGDGTGGFDPPTSIPYVTLL